MSAGATAEVFFVDTDKPRSKVTFASFLAELTKLILSTAR
jgi:hypothetical protein